MRKAIVKRSMNRRTFGAVTAGTGVAIATGFTASAKQSSPEASPVAGGPASEVLLTGLADPRFIAIDGDDVYFTESGTGGDTAVLPNVGEGTPEATEPISMMGNTGSLKKLTADGTVTTVLDGIVSYTFGANGEIVGAAGLALDGAGSAYVAVGAPGPFISELPRTGEEGTLLKVDLANGEYEVVADLLQWELDTNPDPATIDSNPYGTGFADGVVYIADAGGNSIIAYNTESGETSTFAVPGGLPAEFFGEAGNPGRDGAAELDSVPSTVVPGPDGRLYVCYITGGPFPPGFAPVDAYSADGSMQHVVEGLTMTSDIAFDSTGRMYASIVSADMINGGPGQVVRIEDDGTFSVVVDNLAMVAGIAFDGNDNLYVVNKSSMVPGGGELLRITGVTSTVGTSGTPQSGDDEATPVATQDDGYRIDMIDTAFEPTSLTIPANIDVVIHFENKGYLAHDFVLENPKVVSDVLGNGQTTELTLNLAPGEYTFYCSQVGHRALGMEGTITVV